jgi:hypothetical protein
MEFGILAPVMALILLAVFNIAKAAILWEQVWSAAQSIGESATTLAIPTKSGALNSLTVAQANEAMSAIYAEIPWVAAGIATSKSTGPGQRPPISVVLTSVDYFPTQSGCLSNCTYTAEVKWSKASPGGKGSGDFNTAGVTRPCGPLPATSPLTDLYEDSGIYVPDPFVVTDVSLVFTPWLFSALTGSFTLTAHSYVPIRTSQVLPTSSTDDWIQLSDGPMCPAQTGA